jgi:hypothetical protein
VVLPEGGGVWSLIPTWGGILKQFLKGGQIRATSI